jgi:hypothetical protein
MKFENPIMTISKFEVENIVTQSAPAGQQSADEAVEAYIANQTAGAAGGYKIVF